jgi:adenosylcobinamide kinase / adenosylcobinamide-phosphate guanylyltransferase
MMLTLVLGGARSGKSRYAQSLCDSACSVIYVATARREENSGDDEMRERIARHRADRPAEWKTVEEPLDLARAVRETLIEATLLIDCATLWISNLMWEFREEPAAEQNRLILAKIDNLIDAVRLRAERLTEAGTAGEVVIVSNEVGSGLVPEHPVARAFRDLQGFANQRLAWAADNVVFIVAGLPLRLKPETSMCASTLSFRRCQYE